MEQRALTRAEAERRLSEYLRLAWRLHTPGQGNIYGQVLYIINVLLIPVVAMIQSSPRSLVTGLAMTGLALLITAELVPVAVAYMWYFRLERILRASTHIRRRVWPRLVTVAFLCLWIATVLFAIGSLGSPPPAIAGRFLSPLVWAVFALLLSGSLFRMIEERRAE